MELTWRNLHSCVSIFYRSTWTRCCKPAAGFEPVPSTRVRRGSPSSPCRRFSSRTSEITTSVRSEPPPGAITKSRVPAIFLVSLNKFIRRHNDVFVSKIFSSCRSFQPRAMCWCHFPCPLSLRHWYQSKTYLPTLMQSLSFISDQIYC